MKLITHSAQETKELSKTILQKLSGKNIIALYGDLGTGKTTFVQGLAKNIGIKSRILSPTYILMHQYQIPRSTIYNTLVHLDLYRTQSAADLRSIDLAELIKDKKNLVVVEWAEKLDASQLKNALKMKFKTLGENKREITIN